MESTSCGPSTTGSNPGSPRLHDRPAKPDERLPIDRERGRLRCMDAGGYALFGMLELDGERLFNTGFDTEPGATPFDWVAGGGA